MFSAPSKASARAIALVAAGALTSSAAGFGVYAAVSVYRMVRCQVAELVPCAAEPIAKPAAPVAEAQPGPATKVDVDEETAGERPRNQLIGVAASARADVAVTWSEQYIWMLSDLRPILAGEAEVTAVTVDDGGIVYAIRGDDWLGVAGPSGPDRWRQTPLGGETLGLAASGGWLAWLVRPAFGEVGARLALTRDHGRSWQVQALPDGGVEPDEIFEWGVPRIDGDGDIDMVVRFDVLFGCGGGSKSDARFRGHVGSDRWQRIEWKARDPEREAIGMNGASNGRQRFIVGWKDEKTPMLVRLGRRSVDDATVFEHEGWPLEIGPRGMVERGFRVTAVDHLGRPLGVIDGESTAWRWSPETGFTWMERPRS